MEMFERGLPGCVLTRIQQLIRDFDARTDEATTIARIRGKMSEFANYHARPRHPGDDLETRSPGEGNEIQKIFSSDKPARCIPAVGMETKGNKEMRIAIADEPGRRVSGPLDQDPPEMLQKCSKQRKRVLNECARDRTSAKADEGENAAMMATDKPRSLSGQP